MASDLRIGNWIADRGGKEWQIDHWESANKVSAKIPTMVFDGVEMQGHPLTEDVDYLQPIPLTEEWLLRFGFEFINYHTDIDEENPDFIYKEYRKTLDGVGYTYDIVSSPYGVYQFQIDFKWCEKGVAADLQYVHQLQNLYWCLRGEELTHGK